MEMQYQEYLELVWEWVQKMNNVFYCELVHSHVSWGQQASDMTQIPTSAPNIELNFEIKF